MDGKLDGMNMACAIFHVERDASNGVIVHSAEKFKVRQTMKSLKMCSGGDGT